MVAYLSDAWFLAAEEALQADQTLRARTQGVRFSLHQQVKNTPEGDVDYTVQFDNGTTRITVGPNPGATASFTTEYRTAAAIAAGELAAQAAFQSGDLRIGGNVGELMARLPLLADLSDVLGALRIETDFDA